VKGFTGGFKTFNYRNFLSTTRSSAPSTHGHVQASTSKLSREKLINLTKFPHLISLFQNSQKFFLKHTALYRAMSLKIPHKIMAFKPTRLFQEQMQRKVRT
jgi:hypothetical protein